MIIIAYNHGPAMKYNLCTYCIHVLNVCMNRHWDINCDSCPLTMGNSPSILLCMQMMYM